MRLADFAARQVLEVTRQRVPMRVELWNLLARLEA